MTRCAFYADDGTGRPGSKLVEFEHTVDGWNNAMQVIEAGTLVWFACVVDGKLSIGPFSPPEGVTVTRVE